MVMSGLGIFLGFIILAFGAWKKFDLLAVTLAVTAVIAAFNGLSIHETWTGTYMNGFANFTTNYLLIFVFGSLLGQTIGDSGAGWRIADEMTKRVGEKWALWAFLLVITLLLYGGVSIFVIVFFALPIGRDLFKELKIPWYLFPGIALIGTIPPVGTLPGSLQILNIIPTKILGTNLMAGAGVGLVATAVYFLLAFFYLKYLIPRHRENFDLAEFPQTLDIELDEEAMDKRAPSLLASVVPIALALILINVLKLNILYGLLAAAIVGLLLFKDSLDNQLTTINEGLFAGVKPLIFVSAVVGIAETVAIVPFFDLMQEVMLNLNINGLFKITAITNVFAFMTGSSSGSLTMILNLFADNFLSWGYSPELIHRLMSTSALAFDALPWNSVVVIFFTLTGVTYAKGYKYVFMTIVLFPLISALSIIFTSPLFY